MALSEWGITTATELLDTYTGFKPAEEAPFLVGQELDSILGTLVLIIGNEPHTS